MTSYRSVPNQTDRTPYNTSTGERVNSAGVAISQDRLCKACLRLHKRCEHPENETALHYGDWLYIEGVGFRVINDCMGIASYEKVKTKNGTKVIYHKQLNWLDVWVPRYYDEHAFHKKFGINKHLVWRVKRKL